MRYENWKDLKPLESPVPVGTKCVVIKGGGVFEAGRVVFAMHQDFIPQCFAHDGTNSCIKIYQLALFPTTETDEYAKWRKREIWYCAKRLRVNRCIDATLCLDWAEELMSEFEKRYGKCE